MITTLRLEAPLSPPQPDVSAGRSVGSGGSRHETYPHSPTFFTPTSGSRLNGIGGEAGTGLRDLAREGQGGMVFTAGAFFRF